MDERLLRVGVETRDLGRSRSTSALAERALALLVSVLESPRGSFFLFDGTRLSRLASVCRAHPVESVPLPPAAGSPLAALVERREAVLVPDLARITDGTPEPWSDASGGPLLAVPCEDSTGALRAVLCAYGRERPYDADDRAIATIVGRHAAEALLTLEITRQLRAAEQSMRQLVEDALAGICLFQDDRILYANPRIAEMLGLPASEASSLVGRSAIDFFHATDRERVWSDARYRLAGQPLSDRDEIRLQRPDGGVTWAQVLVTVIMHDERPALLVHAVDVSSRKRAEEEKEQLEARFLQAQKMEAIGRLAGGVAHDFNNLLMAISGHTELLARRIPAEHQRHLEHIRKATELAAGLTRQLLAFSRKQVLQVEVVSLNDVVTATHKLLRRIIGEDVTLRLDLEQQAFTVRADPSLIGQVLMNLAVNARDAMPQGGTLTIATANVELDEHQLVGNPPLAPGPYVCLTVGDTGIGMTHDVLDRLFEPFFTTKERGKGTGLGLSMVYGTVSQSGGQICVDSVPGRGTTFRIYFPPASRDAAGPSAAAAGARTPRGSETVLAVEDETEVRELLVSMLEGLGYRVLPGADAEAALRLASEHAGPIPLLLTDVVLPGASGVELAGILTRLRPETRVLYASGYLDDTMPGSGIPEHAVLLRKPFSLDELAKAVRTVLDGR